MNDYINFQKSFKKKYNLWEEISSTFSKIPFIGNKSFSKEIQLISLF
jgi:hypothetical protein